MSNDETRKNDECRMRKLRAPSFRLRASSFFRHSSFGFRHFRFLAASNCRHDAYLVRVFHRGGFLLKETDVLVVDEHVHEPAHIAAFVTNAFLQAGMVLLEVGDDLADVCAGSRDDFLFVRQFPERGWDADGCHGYFYWVGKLIRFADTGY